MYQIASKFVEGTQNCLTSAVSFEVQVASFLYYNSVEKCHRKSTNAFGIFRASVRTIIKRLSYPIATFLGPALTKPPTTENKSDRTHK